jgi:hypothetical protein
MDENLSYKGRNSYFLGICLFILCRSLFVLCMPFARLMHVALQDNEETNHTR